MRRHRITVYRLSDGLILSDSTVTIGEEDAKLAGTPYGWTEGAWGGDEFRIDLDTRQPVPLHSFEPVVEANRISSIPPGTVCLFMGRKEVVDDGVLELETEDPQTIQVTLMKDLYKSLRVEVPCEGQD